MSSKMGFQVWVGTRDGPRVRAQTGHLDFHDHFKERLFSSPTVGPTHEDTLDGRCFRSFGPTTCAFPPLENV